MTGQMPTEAQCLALRLATDARALARELAGLPDLFAASRAESKAAPRARPAPLDDGEMALIKQLAASARSMDFDAARLLVLAEEQADDQRQLYSLTMQMVDTYRVASAVGMDQTVAALSDLVVAMQGQIAPLFPGEEIPGES